MSRYISIGELSKLSGSSIRALRYYDEIGILKPDYVNPDSNYRYYTFEQISALSVIQSCNELDIPLKEFKSYQTASGEFDLQKLVRSGELIAQQKIAHVQEIERKLRSISEMLDIFQEVKRNTNPYIRHCRARPLLTAPYIGSVTDDYAYTRALTELYQQSQRMRLTALYQQGLMAQHCRGEVKYFSFLEVDGGTSEDGLITIPEDDFDCCLYNVAQFKDEYQNRYGRPLSEDTLLLFTDMFESQSIPPIPYIEVQACHFSFFERKSNQKENSLVREAVGGCADAGIGIVM